MKSRMFNKFDPNSKKNEQFLIDLKRLLSSSDGLLNEILDKVSDLYVVRTSSQRESIVDGISANTGKSKVEINYIVYILEFFIKNRLEDENSDTADDWLEDLKSLGVIELDEEEEFLRIAKVLIDDVVPKIEKDVKRQKFTTGLLPVLENIGATVEMRAVNENKFKVGQDLNNYVPRVSDIVPLVSLHIGLDTEENFYFQVSEEALDLMIDSLGAAKKDLSALKDFVKVKD